MAELSCNQQFVLKTGEGRFLPGKRRRQKFERKALVFERAVDYTQHGAHAADTNHVQNLVPVRDNRTRLGNVLPLHHSLVLKDH